jgi:voltage-gated potassium channel Kch
MQQEIDQIEDHHSICGFGRDGRQVVENLQLRQMPMVVVEPDDGANLEGEAEPPRVRSDCTGAPSGSVHLLGEKITSRALHYLRREAIDEIGLGAGLCPGRSEV